MLPIDSKFPQNLHFMSHHVESKDPQIYFKTDLSPVPPAENSFLDLCRVSLFLFPNKYGIVYLSKVTWSLLNKAIEIARNIEHSVTDTESLSGQPSTTERHAQITSEFPELFSDWWGKIKGYQDKVMFTPGVKSEQQNLRWLLLAVRDKEELYRFDAEWVIEKVEGAL